MSVIARDIRFGSRSLRKHLGLSIIAVFALMLGIGLTTTMFSIVYSVMMNGLPYPDADRIVSVFEQNLSRHAQRIDLSVHDFADLRAQQRSFSEIGARVFGNGERERHGKGRALHGHVDDGVDVRHRWSAAATRAYDSRGRGRRWWRACRRPWLCDVEEPIRRRRECHRNDAAR